ncbi:MAG: GNAT family N-acetyltransferase [Clostridiales bacterium]|nr:GNAT family N-acetyltransferase [Clostridiales bacterium]
MRVRKYEERDREDIRNVCKITAGDFFQKNEKRLEAAAVLYNDYYSDNEPENIYVLADDSDRAVGYILCSRDYDRFMQLHKTVYRDKVRKLSPFYPFLITGSVYCLKKIKGHHVHLHIDILPEYQRQGWGTKLIDALCEHLKEEGETHLSVSSISRKAPAYAFYRKYGFSEIYSFGLGSVALSIDL